MQWHHNPSLAYDPFEAVDDASRAKAPNELLVAVAQGRNLAIKDKELLGSGGTSDPRAVLRVVGGSSSPGDPAFAFETKSIKKTLNPRWREVWACPLTAGGPGDAAPVLHCRVEDVDALSAADFMGATAGIPLPTDSAVFRRWHDLAPSDPLDPKRTSENVHGDVELVLLWRHNPALDWDPFDRDAVDASTAPPNELRVAAFRGRRLAIKDKHLFSKGGSSDPRLVFDLGDATVGATRAEPKTVNPVWKEQFVVPLAVTDDPPTLRVRCEDADALSAADPMGSVEVRAWRLPPRVERLRSS